MYFLIALFKGINIDVINALKNKYFFLKYVDFVQIKRTVKKFKMLHSTNIVY